MSADNWAICPNCHVRSWREDYEVYNDDEGSVDIIYSGACSERMGGGCGQQLKYEHVLTLPVVAS